MEIKNWLMRLLAAEHICIYGAGAVACEVYLALRTVWEIPVTQFLVSEKEGNRQEIDGIPVREAEDLAAIHTKTLILIATPQIYHSQIIERLESNLLFNYICVDSHIEYEIMREFFRKQGGFLLLEDLKDMNLPEGEKPDLKVYMAKCHMDRKLSRVYPLPEWVIPVQAGAELTKTSIAMQKDNTGAHISNKNTRYSELTVTYWVWKNTSNEYKGICHYRRWLDIGEEDLHFIRENKVNAILPLPFVCYPDASWQYERYISQADFEILMQALREREPEYYKAAKVLLKGRYLYNYNMLIADRETFDRYCAWMFPVLERIEEINKGQGNIRTDRYIGYAGEILTSLYFLFHKKELKIVHAKKIWGV